MPATAPSGRHTTNNGYPPEPKADAIVASLASNSNLASHDQTGIPLSTIRYWMNYFESWNDSELEAWIARKKRVHGAVWAHLEGEALEFALEAASARNANALYRATWSAGVAHDKVERLGQPKTIDATNIAPTILSSPTTATDEPTKTTDE